MVRAGWPSTVQAPSQEAVGSLGLTLMRMALELALNNSVCAGALLAVKWLLQVRKHRLQVRRAFPAHCQSASLSVRCPQEC